MIINVLHLGFGRVGKELVRQISGFEEVFKSRLDVSLKFCGVFKSNSQIVSTIGYSAGDIIKFGESGLVEGNNFTEVLKGVRAPFIVIDTTASDSTYPWLIKSLNKGGLVILSNKKPLTGSLGSYKKLMNFGGARIFFETVVGAGLPIIKTIKEMQSIGDEVLEIKGAFSGTLGFIFSKIQSGMKFSEAVLEAKERGFTEPDPRDDLSGLDVARKALILSRLLGINIEMPQVKLIGMVPSNMVDLSVEEFLAKLPVFDNFYEKMAKQAKGKGKALRFFVKVNKHRSVARLQKVDIESDIGNLRGPDNIVVIKSKRYFQNPLVIKGPGAGVEVTAAGVFADILEAIKTIKQDVKVSSTGHSLPITL